MSDARALPLPVPAPVPLLARLGVLAYEAVFPSPVVLRRLDVFFRVPFLPSLSDLAFLVCTGQIKFLSIKLFIQVKTIFGSPVGTHFKFILQ